LPRQSCSRVGCQTHLSRAEGHSPCSVQVNHAQATHPATGSLLSSSFAQIPCNSLLHDGHGVVATQQGSSVCWVCTPPSMHTERVVCLDCQCARADPGGTQTTVGQMLFTDANGCQTHQPEPVWLAETDEPLWTWLFAARWCGMCGGLGAQLCSASMDSQRETGVTPSHHHHNTQAT